MQETIELIDDDQDKITDEFLPFLHGNPILAMIYAKSLLLLNLPLQRQAKLSANQQCLMYVRMHKKFCDDEDKCYTYDSKELRIPVPYTLQIRGRIYCFKEGECCQ